MSEKALFLQSKQGKFVVGDSKIPSPKAGEIRVKVEAAGLNPVDWKIATLGILMEEFPAILGFDAAGTVHGLGAGVTGWSIGDRVLIQGSPTQDYGTFRQYSLVPAKLAARLPDKLSFDQGAGLPSAVSTAGIGLYHTDTGPRFTPPWKGGRGKYAGTPIVVLGGASVVGSVAIQYAALSGFSPIITTASPKNEALLRSYGATHVLDRNLSADALKAKVADIAGKPVKTVYDAISLEDTQRAAFGLLAAHGGVLLTVLDVTLGATEREAAGVVAVRVSGLVTLPFNVEFGAELFGALTPLLEEGSFKPLQVEVLPNGLAGIPDGLERLRLNQVSASKLIAHPQETA